MGEHKYFNADSAENVMRWLVVTAFKCNVVPKNVPRIFLALGTESRLLTLDQ